jgi:hypothetical protein
MREVGEAFAEIVQETRCFRKKKLSVDFEFAQDEEHLSLSLVVSVVNP